ncbi:MAG TPA: SPOR domain-containing protein [Rhizomicrobium sp.]|jgi:hypothetical protein|nr:SPOR domain-containing protein [Rhizomicrobium sp.]
MSGSTMRRGAKLTLGGVGIAICIPWLAHGLQNPNAPWLHTTPIVDDLVVLSAPAHKAQSGWAIQVGAYGHADAAGGQLTLLAQRQPDLLGSAMPIVEPVDLPGGKRLFRARFGIFSRQDADVLCDRLRNRGVACMVMADASAPQPPIAEAAVPAGTDASPIPPVNPSAATPPLARPAPVSQPAVQPVQVAKVDRIQTLDDTALADLRGGFFLAGGVQFDFGASVRTMVNGQLALQSTVQWTQGGLMVQHVAGPGTTPIPPSQLAELFGGNAGAQMGVTIPGQSGSTAVLTNLASGQIQNVLMNTANNQTATQNTDVLLTIYNLPQLQQLVSQQLLSARLASDAAAANLINR